VGLLSPVLLQLLVVLEVQQQVQQGQQEGGSRATGLIRAQGVATTIKGQQQQHQLKPQQ
jgi:hypothetical protein